MKTLIFTTFVLLLSACNMGLTTDNPILVSNEAAEKFCKDKQGIAYFGFKYYLRCKNGAELR